MSCHPSPQAETRFSPWPLSLSLFCLSSAGSAFRLCRCLLLIRAYPARPIPPALKSTYGQLAASTKSSSSTPPSLRPYGLAMEYLSQAHASQAHRPCPRRIHSPHPAQPRLRPRYQMSAQTLNQTRPHRRASPAFHAGIAAANRTNNQHALAEMTPCARTSVAKNLSSAFLTWEEVSLDRGK